MSKYRLILAALAVLSACGDESGSGDASALDAPAPDSARDDVGVDALAVDAPSADAEPADAPRSDAAADADITDTSVDAPAADRYASLLNQRFGYGAATTGGLGGIDTLITSFEDDSLLNAITDDEARWIHFDPSLDGETWQVPPGAHEFGANKTIDGRDANISWQFGVPESITGAQGHGYPTTAFDARNGNLIVACITMIGDHVAMPEYEGTFNGPSDGIRIFDGANYWIHNNTFTRMSDESNSITQVPRGAEPDLITQSYNLFFENKNGAIIGSNNADGGYRPRVTQGRNHYLNQFLGRSPGINYNSQTHAFNNVVRGYRTQGLYAGEGADIIAEYNVIAPGCVMNNHSLHVTAGSGRMRVVGDWSIQGDCQRGNDDAMRGQPRDEPFSIPTTPEYRGYTLITEQEALEEHVVASAGALGCDRSFIVRR